MKTGKRSGLFICAGLLAMAFFSGCGGSSTSTTIPAVATVYYSHGVFLNHSSLLTVGYNAFGQLGNGTLVTTAVAAAVPGLGKIKGFAAGAEHTLAFYNNSSVMAWGYNYHGQIGNAGVLTAATSTVACYTASPVRVGNLTHVSQVAAGAFHSLAVSNGSVYSWGYNGSGQLGVGSVNGTALGDATTPVQVEEAGPGGVNPLLANVTQVAAGAYHSLALTSDGKVFAWGDNTYGQLGNQYKDQNNVTDNPPTKTFSSAAIPVTFLQSDGTPYPAVPTQIAAAGSYSLARLSDGSVWAWGYNGYGQLGTTTNMGTLTPTYVPTKVATGLSIDKVSAGLMHVLAQVGDTVWGWGFDERGQLGNNPGISGLVSPNTATPVRAKDSLGNLMTGVTDIEAFGNFSYVKIPISGVVQLWGFGDNNFGQLGQPIITTGISYQAVPRQVLGFLP